MSLAPPPFGVSEFTTTPWTFEQDVEIYARLHVDAIEICEFKLKHARQLQLIDAHALSISSVQPVVRTLFPSRSQSQPWNPPDRLDCFRRTIEFFGLYADGVPFVTNTGLAPDGNFQHVFEVARHEYRALAEFADAHGAKVAFEPLNPSIVNIETSIWTLEQALELVEAVDHESFGICLDYWNVWQNSDIELHIERAGSRILVVQLSDWRTPRSYADRLIVGRGEIPFAPLLRATHAAGYRGAYELEIFSEGVSDSLWEGDLERVITESRAALETAWAAAFS